MVATCIATSLLCSCEDTAARKKALQKEKKAKPTFLFWCFRKEILDADYLVPNMSTPAAAAYLQNKIKGVPGVEGSKYDLETHVLTVSYQSSTIRSMNIEEAIAPVLINDLRDVEPVFFLGSLIVMNFMIYDFINIVFILY